MDSTAAAQNGQYVGAVKTRLLPILLALVVSAACTGGANAPLRSVAGVTRVVVSGRGSGFADSVVITDPRKLDSLTGILQTLNRGWGDPSSFTMPSGDLVAVLYRSDSSVGVLRVGHEFLVERGDSTQLLRNVSGQTEAAIRNLLDPQTSPASGAVR